MVALALALLLAGPPARPARTPTRPPPPTQTPGPDLKPGEALGSFVLDGLSVPLRHAFSWRLRGWDPKANKAAIIWVVVVSEEPIPWETLEPPARYQDLVAEGKVRGLEVTIAGGEILHASLLHESLLPRGGSLLAEGRRRFAASRWQDRVLAGRLTAPDTEYAGYRFQYDVFFEALVRNEVTETP